MYRVQKQPIPLDYSHCRQTVTVYHREKNAGAIHRILIHNTHFEFGKEQALNKTGSTQTNGFLLVIPQSSCQYLADSEYTGVTGTYTLVAQDKVYLGEGIEVTAAEWATFIPAAVNGLVVVQKVSPKYWLGAICHVEASR